MNPHAVDFFEVRERLTYERMLYHFDVSLFARPTGIETAGSAVIRDVRVSLLDSTALAGGQTLPLSFEQGAEALASLLRMDIEPDGYFVWSREQNGKRWQVDGHLFDRGSHLWRIDLRGACPTKSLDRLLTCFGWPHQPFVFQLVREGVTLNETDFRRWALAVRLSK